MRRILWIATLAALMGPLLVVDAEAIFKKLGTTGFRSANRLALWRWDLRIWPFLTISIASSGIRPV